ncbi:hypothetical protein JVT61DRAFT_5282 [Boletus reticuloceps]|uniref:Methyltransferase domain-containing protein n=1 Tax=Boletus reticuloceps TaxID=495285 RepID=A0A8I2YYA8_9AGAM|nr:hypothetical protein JVT61DRAFT_5282 [Boletus reticuloceps]
MTSGRASSSLPFPRLVSITRPTPPSPPLLPFTRSVALFVTAMPVAAPQRQVEPITTGRRVLPRNKDFLNKHGHRHHSIDPDKAPYPLSYDRQVLELESLDLSFLLPLTKSVSIASFTGGPPQRSLDLGCGGGTWVLEAAKEWRNCHFVGFDLVDVQVPLSLLETEIANRISWVHGNFLTTKLPFDDDEFDHVRMNDLGRGIPENKWGVLLEVSRAILPRRSRMLMNVAKRKEVNRVLSPGGTVEVIEHDIIFPTLPNWFTAPLRVRNKRSDSIHHPNGMHHREATPPPSSVDPPSLPHDHVLLESLYYGVFENRFINLRPTAILPIHFTSNFRQVVTAPIVHIRMPAIPPLPALPQPLPANALLMCGEVDKPEAGPQPAASSDMPTLRPSSVSFSSTDSRRTSHSASTEKSSLFERSYSISDANTQLTSNSGDPPSPDSPKTTQITKLPSYVIDWSSAESTVEQWVQLALPHAVGEG